MDAIDLADPDFLDLLRQQDERAFSRLFRQTRDRIYNTVLRMVRCPAEAQDITQDVFLRAYRGLARFRGDSSITSWLYRIAINQVRNRAKYHARRHQRAHDPLDEERHGAARPIPAAVDRPDRKLEAARLEHFLVRALQAMEPDFREVVVLRDIEGLSYAEVQQVTGLEMGTVKSRLHRGRAWLGERMAERDRGESSPLIDRATPAAGSSRPLVLAAFVAGQVR
jgi:RNA polymerase sigma-70 factor (ECF subfamily)